MIRRAPPWSAATMGYQRRTLSIRGCGVCPSPPPLTDVHPGPHPRQLSSEVQGRCRRRPHTRWERQQVQRLEPKWLRALSSSCHARPGEPGSRWGSAPGTASLWEKMFRRTRRLTIPSPFFSPLSLSLLLLLLLLTAPPPSWERGWGTAPSRQVRSRFHPRSRLPSMYRVAKMLVSLSLSLSLSSSSGARFSSSSSTGYAASEMLRGRTPSPRGSVKRRNEALVFTGCYKGEPIFFFYPSPPPYPVHFSSFAGKWSGFLPPEKKEPRKVKE